MLLSVPPFFEQIGKDRFSQLMGVLIFAWALVMIMLEHLFPYTKGVKLFRRGFWIDLVWYTLLQSKVLEIIIFTYIILNLKNALGLGNTGPLSHWNYWLIIAFFLVTHDFYIYWFHRLQHNYKWLWRTHEAHHSLREIDWLAGSRSHFLEILINQTIEFAPIFFLLDSNTAAFVFPAKATLDAIWGMWIHANINVKTGKLQYFFNGPEMHQWHHGNHEEVFFKNFSTKLACWDWIFGTAYLPNLKPLKAYFVKPVMFGLPYAFPAGYFTQTVFSLMRFNIFRLLHNSTYIFILNFRKNISVKILSWVGVEKSRIEQVFFDPQENKYAMDCTVHPCPSCQSPMKYFYRNDQLVKVCDRCESKASNLEKFN